MLASICCDDAFPMLPLDTRRMMQGMTSSPTTMSASRIFEPFTEESGRKFRMSSFVPTCSEKIIIELAFFELDVVFVK